MSRFLVNRRGVALTPVERALLEDAVAEIRTFGPRETIIAAGVEQGESTMLVEGIVSRFIDDRQGMRQLVAVHVSGEFVDLHAYPMKQLDHSIGTLTPVTVAIVPHAALKEILDPRPELERKLWFSTLMDAAMHRAWLFRLGRLDAAGRIAHFLCEMNARLHAVGLSDGVSFALALTQADIAEICGLTTVHTNRVLRQLREAGLCVVRGNRVEILDPAGLAWRGDFTADYLYLADQKGSPDERARPHRTRHEPGVATVEDGLVLLDGPDGVAVTMTAEAAILTGESLIEAGREAQLWDASPQ